MPSTKQNRRKAATKPQTQPKPVAPAAPEPTSESLFDDATPAPPAAEPTPVETAAGDAPAAAPAPEGSDGAQQGQSDAGSSGDEVVEEAEAVTDQSQDDEDDDDAEEAPATDAAIVSEPTAPEPVANADTAAEPPVSAEPSIIRLGLVEGELHRMPLADVLVHLDAFQGRIALITETSAVLDLQKRMRATEGRCAPIYFSTDDDGELEHLVQGVEAVAAAIALPLSSVFVVKVAHGDVGALQSYLAAQQAGNTPTTSEDDLLMAVNAYHQDQPASPA